MQWIAPCTGRPTERGSLYEFLIDLRQTGDYGGVVQVSGDDAASAVEKAQEIVEAVRLSCPEL